MLFGISALNYLPHLYAYLLHFFKHTYNHVDVIPPDADLLVLVGEVPAAVEIEGLHDARARRPEKVLRAAGGGQVREVAAVLAHLHGAFSTCSIL